MLVVLETFGSATVEALLAVEQIRGLVPHITQRVDIEGVLLLILLDDECAVVRSGITDLGEADAGVLEELLQFKLMLIRYLDDHTRGLGEEVLDDIVPC